MRRDFVARNAYRPKSSAVGCLLVAYSVEKLTLSLPADFRRLTNNTDNWLDGGNSTKPDDLREAHDPTMYPLGAFRWEFAQRPQIFPLNRRGEFFNRIDPQRSFEIDDVRANGVLVHR